MIENLALLRFSIDCTRIFSICQINLLLNEAILTVQCQQVITIPKEKGWLYQPTFLIYEYNYFDLLAASLISASTSFNSEELVMLVKTGLYLLESAGTEDMLKIPSSYL